MARDVIAVRIEPDLIDAMDDARGDVTRSKWCRAVIERALRPGAETVTPDLPKATRIAAAAQAAAGPRYKCRCPKEWPSQTMCSDCGWVAR